MHPVCHARVAFQYRAVLHGAFQRFHMWALVFRLRCYIGSTPTHAPPLARGDWLQFINGELVLACQGAPDVAIAKYSFCGGDKGRRARQRWRAIDAPDALPLAHNRRPGSVMITSHSILLAYRYINRPRLAYHIVMSSERPFACRYVN